MLKLFIFSLLCWCSVVRSYRFVSYIDSLTGWWDTSILEAWGVPGYSASYSYNVLIFAFWLSSNTPTDALDPWVSPTSYFATSTMQTITGMSNPSDDDFRTALRNLYNANGITILVSAFGGTDFPTSQYNPVTLGQELSQFVTDYQFNGCDIDWEDSAYFNSGTGEGEQWLISLTTTLRDNLPAPYIITHAPQAPYFMGTSQYKAGGYLTVHKEVGQYINWYNVQFYNQDTSDYSSYQTLFVAADGWSVNSSVYQMINGENDMSISIPYTYIVVGKPAAASDASNTGYVDPNTLYSIFQSAMGNGNPFWNTGFMTWEFSTDETDNFNFANTVAKAF